VLSPDQYGPVGFVVQIQSVEIDALETPLDVREEPPATHPIFSHARTIPASLATCRPVISPARHRQSD
jgi:hypothetical protein